MNTEHLIEIDEESLRQTESREGYERLLADLNRGFYAQAVLSLAAVQRERSALESAPLVTNDGNFHPKAVVAGSDFHYWGQRLGYDCWNDPGFVREYLRDNAESRVNCQMANTTILNPWGQPAHAA